jgi:hypothetical protein
MMQMLREAINSLIFVFVLLATIPSAHSEAVKALSCSLGDVQAAVNSASSGDVVMVPPGECTWSQALLIPDSKKIVLAGSGMDSTVITRAPAGIVVQMYKSGSRVTGFGFIDGTVAVDGQGWRIDHNRIRSSVFRDGVTARGSGGIDHPYGIVDNCIFENNRVLVIGDANLMANSQWTLAIELGSDKAVYIEDCQFTGSVHSNAVDANYAGRYVFRYNTLTDTYIEAHSVQGTHRATRKWEIYNNTIRQINRAMWVPMFLRGGTGVVFNNTLTGAWGSPNITLDNVRSFKSAGEGGSCDGTSPWDGNEEANGYPCRDQIGRSTDAWLWTKENPYPPQQLDPAYFWNNTHGGKAIGVYIHNNSDIHIKEGRDFFNNVQKPGYTPYIYPHPLRQTWADLPLAPPNVRVLLNQ